MKKRIGFALKISILGSIVLLIILKDFYLSYVFGIGLFSGSILTDLFLEKDHC